MSCDVLLTLRLVGELVVHRVDVAPDRLLALLALHNRALTALVDGRQVVLAPPCDHTLAPCQLLFVLLVGELDRVIFLHHLRLLQTALVPLLLVRVSPVALLGIPHGSALTRMLVRLLLLVHVLLLLAVGVVAEVVLGDFRLLDAAVVAAPPLPVAGQLVVAFPPLAGHVAARVRLGDARRPLVVGPAVVAPHLALLLGADHPLALAVVPLLLALDDFVAELLVVVGELLGRQAG